MLIQRTNLGDAETGEQSPLLAGQLSPELLRDLRFIQTLSEKRGDRRFLYGEYADLGIEQAGMYPPKPDSPSSLTLTQNEKIKQALLRDLVCRVRIFISDKILRITQERFSQGVFHDKTHHRSDRVVRAEEITQADLNELESIISTFCVLLKQALEREESQKQMKQLQRETMAKANTSPHSHPFGTF